MRPLGRLQNIDAVPYGGAAAPEIQRDVPIAVRRHCNTSRQPLVVTAEIVVPAASSVALEIAVAHEADITAMAAIDHDDVAFVQIFALMQELRGPALS
jgi:hypothetical protein